MNDRLEGAARPIDQANYRVQDIIVALTNRSEVRLLFRQQLVRWADGDEIPIVGSVW